MLPQLLYLMLVALGLGITMSKHGEETEINAFYSLISMAITFSLLWWGEFFSVFG